ncbi:MAG: glycosyltransferase family 4 protein [Candidatus Latescibacteria bacterium]|nr:glycosyltransferase family 4 protein [Candidatus Latescibacterota bacterium]
MRIGIDVSVLREPARGVGHYLLNILNRLSKFAHNDQFFLYSPKPIVYDFSDWHNKHLRWGKTILPGAFWLQTQAKRFIKKDRLDVFFGPAHILPLRLPAGMRKVLAVHDLVSTLYPQTMANYNRFVHNLYFQQSVHQSDHIITMSEHTKKSIIDNFKFCPDRITVIYEGVNPDFKLLPKQEVQPVLQRYQIQKPYFLAVGTLEPRKNYPVLLQAFKHFSKDYDLVIIGKQGWKAQKIFKMISDLQLEKSVKILGYVHVNELPHFYNGAELFIFPSLYEGFGLPLVEAMACGAAVICSNASCLPEIGGDAAVYFHSQSVDQLTSKIEQVLTSPQLRQSLREKGIRQASNFNWNITAQKTLAVLKGQ